jgi:hypothetical protein
MESQAATAAGYLQAWDKRLFTRMLIFLFNNPASSQVGVSFWLIM